MKRFHILTLISFLGLGLMFGAHALSFAQSGAPNLIQFHGQLVDPMTGQLITAPAQIRIQIIHGGTAEENPSTGRIVFSEQTDMRPDANGEFDYAIGSHAPGAGTGRARLDAEDFNTTQPVFLEIGLVQPNGTVQVLLPRQRLASVPYALQAAAAAISTDDTLMGNGVGETPLGIADAGVGTPQLADNAVTGAKIAPGQVVKSLNGLFDNVSLQAGSNITVTPTGNMLTIAAPNALSSVTTNTTLTGNGTSGMPLGVSPALQLNTLRVGIPSPAFSTPGTITAFSESSPFNFTVAVIGYGTSTDWGVIGVSDTGVGVQGNSSSGVGVVAQSSSGDIIRGFDGGTERFRVTNDGRMGIGITNPQAMLHGVATGGDTGVRGQSDSGPGVRGNSSTNIAVMGESNGSADLFRGLSGGLNRFIVDNDGDVSAKSFTPASDIRLKTNIQPLTDALERLQHIHGISFEWTNVNPSPASREIGVIAQEVEAVFPELVKPWGDQGYKGVSYDGLTAVLLEGVKALKAENETLHAEVASLRQMLHELKAELKNSGH